MEIEGQVRVAIRDALNRKSRKPFYWGGLKGYEQLEAIAQALGEVACDEPKTDYLRWLKRRVDRAREVPSQRGGSPGSPYVAAAYRCLSQVSAFGLCPRQAQAALYGAWPRTWRDYGPDLLPCYDIPGLPPDNLLLESLFGRLRRHQRRVSGRKSTRELRDFGQYQVLFLAESEAELLEQIRQVPLEEYRENRRRLEEAEAPRQLLHRLHRNPLGTMRGLVKQHAARRAALASTDDKSPPQSGDT